MLDELLKRLDEVMAYQARKVADEWGPFDDESPDALIQEWATLRADLVAARCENCAHWGMTNRGDGPEPCDDELPGIFAHLKQCGGLNELRVDDYTSFYQGTATGPNFCCSHFEKKETT